MPVAEIPVVRRRPPRRPAAPLHRRFLVSTIRFVVIVILGAVVAGGWYLAKRGFGRSWRALVVEELHKRGVEASVQRLTLDPFRGLVAQDVRIFDYKERENTIAEISRVALDVNYAALLQHQSFLNALDIRNARVTLPLPAGADPKSPHAQISDLHAHVYFPPEQIYVSQADGIFGGVHFSATGQLIKRNDYRPSREITEKEWQRRFRLLQRVVTELSKFKFPARPQLQIKFSGDIAELENARVEGSLRASELQRGNYKMRNLTVSAGFADQTLSINQCEWQDEFGGLSANAVWHQERGDVEFAVRSGLNLRAFLDGFDLSRILPDIRFVAPPYIDLTGHARIGENGPAWQAIGRAVFDRFTYKSIPFLGATAEFSWDGERTMLRDIHVRHQTGELTAQLLDAPNDFRLDFASTIDASALRSLAPADLRHFVNYWDWPHASNVQLTIRGRGHDVATWRGSGTLQLERGRFRNAGFNSASADIRFADGAVNYDNFHVARDEGVATGTFVYDFAHRQTRFSNVRSTLRPTEAVNWIDPTLLKTITPYKFPRPPVVTVNGIYQLGGGKNTRVDIGVDSPPGMEYVFLGKTLPFDRINARLLFTDDRLQITQLTGAIYSGEIGGSADISLAKNNPRYRATVAVERLDFPRLTEIYFNYKTAQGFLNGHFDWTGVGSDARTINGQGGLEVRNGDLFAIPVFGPLSNLLNTVLPGMGYRVARKATMSFIVKEGVIRTPDFRVDAGTFGMIGDGDSHFLDDKIDFEVRVDASGAGFVLNPLYKFFEYKAEGSLSHPTWRPKNF